MHLFYTPDIIGKTYTLDENESKHCIKVLRLSLNETLHLVDGKGGFYTAHISDPNPKKCTVEITDIIREYGKRDHYLHIAIAPTKNMDRLEWFVEKATEIGIDEITPLICEHSERKHLKNDRLEKIIVSAVKQSVKAYKPQLNQAIPFNDILKLPFSGNKYMAHCLDQNTQPLFTHYTKGTNALILIGPEGDFSQNELKQALQHNYTGANLGKSRLRTETAAIAACHTINVLNG